MDHERDKRIETEYAAGADVAAIAARYDVSEAYVERVIEEAAVRHPTRKIWLQSPLDRIVLSLLVGLLTWLAFRIPWLPLLVCVVFYVLVTAVVSRKES